jgi:hypothetical protein
MRFPLSLIIFLIVFLPAGNLSAQLNFDYVAGTTLIKGSVMDAETGVPIPRANVQLYEKRKGWSCDENGNFALYVRPTDTLKFTHIGYLSKIVPISRIDSASYYTLEISLIRDMIKLKEVKIYPFSRNEFNQVFIEYKDPNKIRIPGIAEPTYSNKKPKSSVLNPISFLYDKFRKKPKPLTPELPPSDPDNVED